MGELTPGSVIFQSVFVIFVMRSLSWIDPWPLREPDQPGDVDSYLEWVLDLIRSNKTSIGLSRHKAAFSIDIRYFLLI